MDDYSEFCIRASRGDSGGVGGGTGTKCGRWNPTSEQVKVLTELFRSGLRTPSTDQIQKISSELSFYGKIESKNVFYWFQNHKARERQKRRRVSLVDELDTDQIFQTISPIPHENLTNKVSPTKLLAEMNEVSEPAAERVIETLQLFPINGTDVKLFNHEDICNKENSYKITTEMNHPTLDLRLSFI